MAGIFISYRRSGSQGFAGRLADDLIEHFGQDRVFRDVEIQPGEDFSKVIERAIAACDVLLVMMGPDWEGHQNSKGELRLHEPDDWVRLEIEAAFALNAWVVPVLVGGARMPEAALLPRAIRRLSRIQAFELSDRRWDRDVDQLAEMMAKRIPGIRSFRKRRPNGRSDLPNHRSESPGRGIRDLGIRILDEIRRKRPAPHVPGSPSKRMWGWVWSRLGRLVKQVISAAILAGVIYFLIDTYGDAKTKKVLNDLISWIMSRF